MPGSREVALAEGRVIEQPARPMGIRQMRETRRVPIPAELGTAADAALRDPTEPTRRPASKASAWLLDNPDKPEESQKGVFLAALRAYGNIRLACEAAKIPRATYRAWIKQKKFGQQAADALDDFVDSIELDAVKRARAGSDVIIKFLLSSRRPEVYGQRLTVDHDLTPQERTAIVAMAKAEGLDPDGILADVEDTMKRLPARAGG